jgi:hypothetical protein
MEASSEDEDAQKKSDDIHDETTKDAICFINPTS